jgi:hypothetical protein
MTAV